MDFKLRLTELCEPALAESGYELVWAEVSGTEGRHRVGLFIDKPGGLTVEDCAAASRRIAPLIEESGIFQKYYVLEVSSPGLDRPLFKSGDYERFAGRKARLKLKEPLGNRRNFTGLLRGLQGGKLILLELEDGRREEIPLELVQRANLIFEWE